MLWRQLRAQILQARVDRTSEATLLRLVEGLEPEQQRALHALLRKVEEDAERTGKRAGARQPWRRW